MSTTFPVPTFHNKDDTSPQEFLRFLNNLIQDNFAGDERRKIPAKNRGSWAPVTLALSENFLSPIQPNAAFPWDSLKEKVKLAEVTLELVRHVTRRVEEIYSGTEDLAKNIFTRVLVFCASLEAWPNIDDDTKGETLSPIELKEKAFAVCVDLLRSLGDASNHEQPTWKILREILAEMLDLSRDLLLGVPGSTFPLSIGLFETPRVKGAEASGVLTPVVAESSRLKIASSSLLASFLALCADVATRAVCPATLPQWYLLDLHQKIAKNVHNVFDFCFESSCSTTLSRRAQSLTRILVCANVLLSTRIGCEPELRSLPAVLLRRRLSEGPNPDAADGSFCTVIESCSNFRLSDRDILTIVETISQEPWGEGGKDLMSLAISCIRRELSYMPVPLLERCLDILRRNEGDTAAAELITEVERRLQDVKLSQTSLVIDQNTLWRSKLRDSVESIVAPNTLNWMEEDNGSLSNTSFVDRALAEIKARFERSNFSGEGLARLWLAERLLGLSQLLSQFAVDSYQSNFLSISLLVLPSLSRNSDDDNSPQTRKQAFVALAHSLRCNQARIGPEDWELVKETILNGLEDEDRSVRLSAGHALVELFRSENLPDLDLERSLRPFFDRFHALLECSKDRIKDSLLITLGRLGRISQPEVLERAIFCIVSQFGEQNPVIRGLAFVQMLDIAKFHNKTPLKLLSPLSRKLAPYVISKMHKQPSILNEYCRLLAISHIDYMSSTLNFTLPQLFASSELKVIERIAKDLGQTVHKLFLDYSRLVLAQIFLLPSPEETRKALNFVLEILTAAAQNTTIDVQSVVGSCIVPLLVELVISMGDEEDGKAQLAVSALEKVEQSLSSTSTKPAPNLGEFLRKYMLGVISGIINNLHDADGKRSNVPKQQILRSLGTLISLIGPTISSVAPQVMATLQTMLGAQELVHVTLECWKLFTFTINPKEIYPHVGPTTASFVLSWPTFSLAEKLIAKEITEFIVFDIASRTGEDLLEEVVDLSTVPELQAAQLRLEDLRKNWVPKERLRRILERSSSDNFSLAWQSLRELKTFLIDQSDLMRELSSGDSFDPLIGQTLKVLFAAACRDVLGADALRLLAYECFGILGAVDPDRCEFKLQEPKMFVLTGSTTDDEAAGFAMHLITDLLVGAFRSTTDMRYQSHLAYTIQELLRFCNFNPGLVGTRGGSVSLRVRNRWNSLPKHVHETVTPLLEGRFSTAPKRLPALEHPIYNHYPTYREWLQLWTSYLITRASGNFAQTIFGVFRAVIIDKDVGVAHHLLPHLVLNILISGNEDDANQIRSELLAVLKDQVDSQSTSTSDKKILSAQAVFMLFDHLNKWLRNIRQEISSKKVESKRLRTLHAKTPDEEQCVQVDSIITSIDKQLMATAALNCKAYARSLMNFEQHVVDLKERTAITGDLSQYYERLHEIYADLEEPDGMEGVSTLILSPSLEHQIRQNESTGRWTAAQSCWEVRLQQSPDNLDFHLGLLRCLRNLGHYDTLRTHVQGVLVRNPDWESSLAGYQAESAWAVGAWDDVQKIVESTKSQSAQIHIAKILLAMRTGDDSLVSSTMTSARAVLGMPLLASGLKDYRRTYEAVLNLHLTHELHLIRQIMGSISSNSQEPALSRRRTLKGLSQHLTSRLDATLPTFGTREPILSLRRVAFAIASAPRNIFKREIGKSWLASAKIARKAGQWQTAYSAMLQTKHCNVRFSFMEGAKLTRATGEPLRALQDLESAMKLSGLVEDKQPADVIDLTEEDEESAKLKAKAMVLRARWLNDSDRCEVSHILRIFQKAVNDCHRWESGHYHIGQFHDEIFRTLSTADKRARGVKMNLYTVRSFARAIKFGSKYIYQTVPRLLTIWLDIGEDGQLLNSDNFKKINEAVSKAIDETPTYKWFTAFPQIVSRVGHENDDVYEHLQKLIVNVMQEYPKQALWLFSSVIKSTKIVREHRGKKILEKLRGTPHNRSKISKLVVECVSMTKELLALCDHPIVDENKRTLSMRKTFPKLEKLGSSSLLIPLQESLTASLPPTSASESLHQPFPVDSPTFHGFADEIEVMRSLARPRKITIYGSDGQTYMFLGKPKDDLRKDARLMDFNSIINKLLKANSESRRRQLHIRTYGVVTLNEECGFIQWVPNTTPIRPVLIKYYDARKIRSWSNELGDHLKLIKGNSDIIAAEKFKTEILGVICPVLHEWFIETFPEPSAWLASRLAYGRTAAVMCMVGFILGLGDRHCENILLDDTTGDMIHVDFNCLFEKGKTLETPECVPFRLTQNIIDGLGVTGVEGVFRIACEVTLQLLRDNKDSLMSVLDAFVHDPLVEWEDEKRKLERDPTRSSRNHVKSSVDLRMLAKGALNPIERKLKGIYTTSQERREKETSTSNLVEMLIQEATDPINLVRMYVGWASWH